jgi:glycosyltransferase involved in cell wall biosynthesis
VIVPLVHLLAFIESRAFHVADAIAFVSVRAKAETERYCRHSTVSAVIPNAIDRVHLALVPSQAPREPIVLWVGNNSRQKNIVGALAVAEVLALTRPQARIRVVGVTSRRATPNVEFLGTLSPSSLADQYRCARVLLSTSRYEGDPLTLKEALANGIPVVAMRDSAEAIEHGQNGLLIDELDTRAGVLETANALALILDDIDLWSRFSVRAAQLRETLHPEVEARAYAHLYATLTKWSSDP